MQVANWERFADLEQAAGKRGITLGDLEAAVSRIPERPKASLSRQDVAALQSMGIVPMDGATVPKLAGALHRNSLESESLTAEQVGALLGRDPSRIRQRLAGPARSLLGFHRHSGRHEWLLPQMQFVLGLHEMAAWGLLLQALPPADKTAPTALVAWLFDSRPHLNGRSRGGALADGYDVDALIAEAATFGMPG